MKKQTGATVSLVLAVASFFTMKTGLSTGGIAGAGLGTDQQVSTLSDMYEMLDYFSTGGGRSVESTALMKTEKIDSLTMVENGEMSLSQQIGGETQSVTINKTMTLYLTEEAGYYISKGMSVRENDSSKRVSYFDVHVYIGVNTVFVKFNEYSSTSTIEGEDGEEDSKGYMVIKPSKKGIWIECPIEVAAMFNFADELNASTFNSFKQIIREGIEDKNSKLDRDGDVYTLEENFEDNTSTFICDLSNKKAPHIQTISKVKEKTEQGKYSVSTYSQMEFRNIGNTVINGNIKADYVCKDLEEYDKLFNIKE